MVDLLESSLFSNKKSYYKASKQEVYKNDKKEIPNKLDNNLEFFGFTDINIQFKNQNEDYIIMECDFHEKMSVFSIFDGHGGKEAAEYLQSNLIKQLKNFINQAQLFDDTKETVLKNVFSTLNNQLKFVCSENVGSTCTTILLDYENIYCANVGDSKAYLFFDDDTYKQLTEDHLLSNKSEEERIKHAGGNISKNRLNGVLCLTRSIGDHFLNNHGLISTPFVSQDKIKHNSWLILASDGIWDVIKPEECFSYLKKSNDCSEIVYDLIESSKKLGSKDNISCILVKIK